MKKLELKHITGYLPYELKVLIGNLAPRIVVFNHGTYDRKTIGLSFILEDGYNIKPILRPMSDLNNEKYLSLFESQAFVKEVDWDSTDEDSLFYYDQELCLIQYTFKEPENFSLDFLEFLWRNHFDVHGLIDDGLAVVDINTLNQTP